MDVGGEEPEPDSPVCVEARERFESCAERFDSTTVDAGLSTAGEDQPFMESRLPNAPTRPDLGGTLEPLMLSDSEWRTCCGFGGASK